MNVLSISSQVVYGHVGNSAAGFALQRLGHEAWCVPTVLLAHHPGHGVPRGRITPEGELAALFDGLEERGWLAGVNAVLTGYFGSPGQVAVAASTIERIRRKSPGARILVDPIMGDGEGDGARIYVRDGVVDAIRQELLPAADIATPNRFELELLTGRTIATQQDAIDAARTLGPAEVVVTSAPARAPAEIATLAIGPDGKTHVVELLRRPNPPNGLGDTLAALYLARRMENRTVGDALALSAGSVGALIARAAHAGAAELPLIEAQDLLTDPGSVSLRAISDDLE